MKLAILSATLGAACAFSPSANVQQGSALRMSETTAEATPEAVVEANNMTNFSSIHVIDRIYFEGSFCF